VREIADADADIVHCQSYHTFVAPLAMGAAIRCRFPYVVSFHSGPHASALRTSLGRAAAGASPLPTSCRASHLRVGV
jgi:hypothetical protein